MIDVPLIAISIGFILAGIGAFFAFRCLILWRRISITGVSVEVSKDRSFLSNNLRLVLTIGGLAGLHIFFEMIEQFLTLPASIWKIFYFVYYLDLVLMMFVLLILAIVWYRLLSKVSRWDKHWIKAIRRS